MFNVGDVIIYAEHGLSKIKEIKEMTIANVTRMYYVLHPLEDESLKISTPVDNDKVVMLEMMDEKEAEEILYSFKEPGHEWIEDHRQRVIRFQQSIKSGNRKKIANIANSMMRMELELKLKDKKLYDQDRKILESIQNILFKEIAMSLNTTFEDISQQVQQMIQR